MLQPRPSCAVGIDVGGTKIAAGIVAWPSGKVLVRRVSATQPHRGGRAVFGEVYRIAETLLNEARSMDLIPGGVGVSLAELVDREGNPTSAHTIDWTDIAVVVELSQLGNAVLEADVRAAALAEAMFGAGRERRSFVYVTVGTGISSCLVQEGRPWPGARGNALILGSGRMSVRCQNCGRPAEEVLEEVASGPALVSRFNAAGGRQVARAEEVIAAAQDDDRAALEIVAGAGEALGNNVAFMVNLLDPEAVVVGGGLGLAGGLYWRSFEATVRRRIWAPNATALPIVPAALGADAGLVGAAARVMQNQCQQ